MDVNYGGKQKHTQILQNIEKIQNKALRILNFKNPWEPIEQIYKEPKIFKLKIYCSHEQFEICIWSNEQNFTKSFWKIFINKTRQHLYNARGNSLDVPQVKTTTYGSNSFTLHAIRKWNFFLSKLSTTTSFPNFTPTIFIKVIKIYISEKTWIPQSKLQSFKSSGFLIPLKTCSKH